MNIECVQEKLAEGLYKIDRIAGKHPTLPILSSVLLKAEGNTLTLRATNLDIGIEVNLSVKVKKEGEVAVPASALSSYISSLRGKSVALSLSDSRLKVTGEHSEAEFSVSDTSEFPTIPQVEKEKTTQISSSKLREGFQSVVFSASTSSIKPELSSVYVHEREGMLVFVATDSFRLAEKKMTDVPVEGFESLLVPHKNVTEIIRLLEKINGDVEVRFGENQIALIGGDIYLTSRTVDGAFPDYKQIIPEGFTTRAAVLRQDLMDTLKLSTIFSGKFNQVTFDVKPKENIFTILTHSSEIGESRTEVPATLEGEEVTMHFNHRYVNDVFSVLTDESIDLRFNGTAKPLIVRGKRRDDFTYIVMPMNK